MAWHEKDHQREIDRRAARVATGQITIGQIIQKCEMLPDLPVVVHCALVEFDGVYPSEPDSYRGYYDELAIDISRDKEVTLSTFIEWMVDSLHQVYSGHKGGEYNMCEDTFVWLAGCGESTGIAVTDVCLSPDGDIIRLVCNKIADL
jgi:hypothetical protein